MPFRVRVMAVPPASALIPTEAIALAMPITSASLMFICLPTPARRADSSMISASVEAPLLPSWTRVAPSRSTLSVLVPMMFMNWAMLVAAWSALRFVVAPSWIIVSENFATSSRAMPSCPAASATAAIFAWVSGIERAMERSWSSSTPICSVVPSTVLVTPVKSDCQSMAAFDTSPTTAVATAPTFSRSLETVFQDWVCDALARPLAMLWVAAEAFAIAVMKLLTLAASLTVTVRDDPAEVAAISSPPAVSSCQVLSMRSTRQCR